MAVGPVERTGVAVVESNVAHDLPSQVCDRLKDASRDHIPLYLREPQLDLIQPRAVRGCEMESQSWMFLQERCHGLGFVGGEVVRDDVDLLSGRLAVQDLPEESNELGTRVPLRRLAQYLPGAGVERRVEREGSMPVILESMALNSSRRQRQDRIEPVERLNGGLLVDAEDHGVGGRVKVQADDISGLLLEIRIVAGDVSTKAMGLKSRFRPHSRDAHRIGADQTRDLPRAPVSGPVLGGTLGQRQDSGLKAGSLSLRLAPLVPRIQAGQASRREALGPKPHGVDRAAQLPGDLVLGHPIRQPENDVSPLHVGCRQRPCPTSRLKFGTFFGGNRERCHARDTTEWYITYQCYSALVDCNIGI